MLLGLSKPNDGTTQGERETEIELDLTSGPEEVDFGDSASSQGDTGMTINHEDFNSDQDKPATLIIAMTAMMTTTTMIMMMIMMIMIMMMMMMMMMMMIIALFNKKWSRLPDFACLYTRSQQIRQLSSRPQVVPRPRHHHRKEAKPIVAVVAKATAATATTTPKTRTV